VVNIATGTEHLSWRGSLHASPLRDMKLTGCLFSGSQGNLRHSLQWSRPSRVPWLRFCRHRYRWRCPRRDVLLQGSWKGRRPPAADRRRESRHCESVQLTGLDRTHALGHPWPSLGGELPPAAIGSDQRLHCRPQWHRHQCRRPPTRPPKPRLQV